MSVNWQDPPPTKAGRSASKHRRDLIAELKKHPGRWALGEERAARSSGVSNWKKLGCEATSRTRDDGEGYDIYVRWPEVDLATVDPTIAARRARGVPAGGVRSVANPLRRIS